MVHPHLRPPFNPFPYCTQEFWRILIGNRGRHLHLRFRQHSLQRHNVHPLDFRRRWRAYRCCRSLDLYCVNCTSEDGAHGGRCRCSYTDSCGVSRCYVELATNVSSKERHSKTSWDFGMDLTKTISSGMLCDDGAVQVRIHSTSQQPPKHHNRDWWWMYPGSIRAHKRRNCHRMFKHRRWTYSVRSWRTTFSGDNHQFSVYSCNHRYHICSSATVEIFKLRSWVCIIREPIFAEWWFVTHYAYPNNI